MRLAPEALRDAKRVVLRYDFACGEVVGDCHRFESVFAGCGIKDYPYFFDLCDVLEHLCELNGSVSFLIPSLEILVYKFCGSFYVSVRVINSFVWRTNLGIVIEECVAEGWGCNVAEVGMAHDEPGIRLVEGQVAVLFVQVSYILSVELEYIYHFRILHYLVAKSQC